MKNINDWVAKYNYFDFTDKEGIRGISHELLRDIIEKCIELEERCIDLEERIDDVEEQLAKPQSVLISEAKSRKEIEKMYKKQPRIRKTPVKRSNKKKENSK